jgi:competence protein ComEA
MDIRSSLITTLLVSVLAVPALAANQSMMESYPIATAQPLKSDASLVTLAKGVKANVNINTADAETLSLELKGVGPKRAEAIIAYRNQHGPFKSIEDLLKIKGIGKKMLEKNREKIII